MTLIIWGTLIIIIIIEGDLTVDGDVEGDEEDQGGDPVHHQVGIDQVKPGERRKVATGS